MIFIERHICIILSFASDVTLGSLFEQREFAEAERGFIDMFEACTICPSVISFLHVTRCPEDSAAESPFKRLTNISLYVYVTFSLSIRVSMALTWLPHHACRDEGCRAHACANISLGSHFDPFG